MPCYLLHMVEMPVERPYDDNSLKDLVGEMPRMFCTQCNPPLELPPGDAVRCLDRDAPCWKPEGHICDT